MPMIAAYNFCNRNFDGFIAGAAAAGFKHVAIGFYTGYYNQPIETMSDDDMRALRARLDFHDLTPVAAFIRSDLQAEGGLDMLLRRLDGVKRFGVSIADTGAGHIPEDASDDERERITASFVEQIRAAGDHAADLGITIALETHGGMTGSSPACLSLMERVDHPNVRIAYDPANFRFYAGADPMERLDELVPFIAHTHYKDHTGPKGNAEFPLIGEGEVGYDRLLPRLIELGYDGPHTLERAPGRTDDEIEDSMVLAYEYLTRMLG
ncbi:MAG: sugar phosphate isomerase/epimerase [candidate division WS1 bacterium]|jgi:sugar phosphate isomerase/epimerase|nr:sugar phosphate isomerase/epimerase [candidate division WS1 bacterium]